MPKFVPKKLQHFLLGVGNSLRGDDGAGPFVAQHFCDDSWLTVDGGSAPENFTSMIKKIRPQSLVIVDAVWMNLQPGSLRIIPFNRISELQLSTHSVPLAYLFEYLGPYCKEIILVGIQPLSIQMGEELSKSVLKGCHEFIHILKNNRLKNIKRYNTTLF